jgi:hypothetical protein
MKTARHFLKSYLHFEPDRAPEISGTSLEVTIDACGQIAVSDRTCFSDMTSTQIVQVREEKMRTNINTLPSEEDMTQTGLEIQNLCDQEKALLPQLRSAFHELMTSAKWQLKEIYQELADPRMRIQSKSIDLRNLIHKHWGKLSATLVMAESYCPNTSRHRTNRT